MEMTEEKKTEAEPPRASKTYSTIGFIITGVWLFGLLVYICLNLDGLFGLEPNELGDFAAGAFAPLAFLWLVLGFFQQGEELRYSGKALWLQGEELRNSVEQQRELVNVTREQLQFESTVLKQQQDELNRNSQPILELREGGNVGWDNNTRLHDFIIYNHGKRCTALKVMISGTIQAESTMLDTGHDRVIKLSFPSGNIDPFPVVIYYLDERSMQGSQSFEVSRVGPSFDIKRLPNQEDQVL